MADRLTLLTNLAKHKPRLGGTANTDFEAGLGALIDMISREFSLDEARTVRADVGPDFDVMFDTVLPEKTLKVLSSKWDPKRVLGSGVSKGDLVRDLRDLVNGRRRPYDPSAPALVEFRGSGSPEAQTRWLDELARFGDKKHVSAVLKKWDPHLKSPPEEIHGMVQHLRALAGGYARPTPKFNPKPDALERFRSLPTDARTDWLDALGEVGTLAQQRAVLKKWDPHCGTPAPDLLSRIRNLGLGRAEPERKPAPTSRGAKRGARTAAAV